MKKLAIIAPLLLCGCAGQLAGQLASGGIGALTNGGSVTPLTNVCVTLLGQEAMDIATLKAQLEATAAAPITVMVPTPMPVTVTPKTGSAPVVVMPTPSTPPSSLPTKPTPVG